MSFDPVLSRLGLARKAKMLAVGFAASKDALQRKTAKLILIANDISAKSEKEIRYFAKDKATVGRTVYSTDQLSKAIGLRGGIIAVLDQGFADAILKQNPFGSTLKEDNTYADKI